MQHKRHGDFSLYQFPLKANGSACFICIKGTWSNYGQNTTVKWLFIYLFITEVKFLFYLSEK